VFVVVGRAAAMLVLGEATGTELLVPPTGNDPLGSPVK
jgi:hypothetical protein